MAQSDRSPKPLVDKIGIKPGMRVLVIGRQRPASEDDFWPTVRERATVVTRGTENNVVFFFADNVDHLMQLSLLRSRIVPNGAIWVIYPKSVKSIREVDVITAAKDNGLVDNKIASYSDTHSAMRLVVPLARRK